MANGANGQELIDEAFFRKYRALADAEDSAFDELEHAYEEGDREHFDLDLAMFCDAVRRRQAFLDRHQGVLVA